MLLQLHRQFFARALSTLAEHFSRKHRYAPSVVAVFLSASRMITSLQEFHDREPVLAGRILGYWSNAYSAAVSNVLKKRRHHLKSRLQYGSFMFLTPTNQSRHLIVGGVMPACNSGSICMPLSGGLARIGTYENSVPCCKGNMSKSNANCCEWHHKTGLETPD